MNYRIIRNERNYLVIKTNKSNDLSHFVKFYNGERCMLCDKSIPLDKRNYWYIHKTGWEAHHRIARVLCSNKCVLVIAL